MATAEIYNMAKAHLVNVAQQREHLLQQSKELEKKIEEITEYLEKGLRILNSETIISSSDGEDADETDDSVFAGSSG